MKTWGNIRKMEWNCKFGRRFKHRFVCIDIRQSRQKIDIGFDRVKAELINTY